MSDQFHTVVFSGHMIDSAERKSKRFPPEKEIQVANEIRKSLEDEKKISLFPLKGIAGGACGGDILFLETCLQLNITTEMFLAQPIEEFKKHSVSFAGVNWERRFDSLLKKLPVHVLDRAADDEKGNVWEQTNKWMMDVALKNGEENTSLIALWDKNPTTKKGGTEGMISIANEKGVRVTLIDIGKL